MKITVKETNPSSHLLEEWTFSFWFGGDSSHLQLDIYRCGYAKTGKIRPHTGWTEHVRDVGTGLSEVPAIPESVIQKARADLLRQFKQLPVVK